MGRKALLVGLALVVVGCGEAHEPQIDGGADAAMPGGDDAGGGADSGPPLPPATELDLLIMADDSGSLTEEQAEMAAQMPAFLDALSTRFTSIQVGVITSDMGVGGYTLPTCVNPDFGADGILRTAGNTSNPGCAANYPRFLRWETGGAQPIDELARGVSCLAQTGPGGCGFEQPLEAVLKALTPTGPTPWTAATFSVVGTPGAPDGLDEPFFRMTSPHGNVANDGFVREDSMLAVLALTDDDDCSVRDPELFDVSSPTYGETTVNLRCFGYPEALHPVSRYVRGLLQLRRHPSRLAYLVLAGLPEELEPEAGAPIAWDPLISPDSSVRDPRMLERVDSSMPNRLLPSCSTANGIAFPPVRILQTAQQLESRGARVAIGSSCADGYSTAFASFLAALSR